MSVKELKELGVDMGLSGRDLLDFVKEQQQILKEEKKSEKEFELAKLAQENARLEREKELKEREIELKESEKARLAKEMEFLELRKRMGVEEDLNSSSISTSSSSNSNTRRMPTPKMPHFDEKEDLDAYILRFERFAKAHDWPRDQWALNLSLCLKGESLRVYSRLASNDSEDYDKLKEALLKRFQFTEEGFRLRFRKEKPKKGETATQFMARIENYLVRWLELGKIEKNFKDVIDLMLREQFLNVCNKELSLFLREHDCKSSKKLTELADKYLEAHDQNMENFVLKYPQDKKGPQVRRDDNLSQNNFENKSQSNGHKRTGPKCFVCGKIGHKASDCRQKFSAGTTRAQAAVTGERVSGAKPSTPKEVKQNDHQTGQTASTCLMKQIEESASHKINLACGHDIPVVSAACKEPCELTEKILENVLERMPVVEGYLGGKKVSVLRDSGCSGVIVKRALVSDDQLTGVDQLCVLIDGTVRKTPEAHIDVCTPFFTGPLKALCMRNPVYDLIIGNIEGVRGPDDPDPEWDKRTTEVQHLEHKKVQRSYENSSNMSEELVNDSTEESKLTATVKENSNVTNNLEDEVTDVVGAVETSKAKKQRKVRKFVHFELRVFLLKMLHQSS